MNQKLVKFRTMLNKEDAGKLLLRVCTGGLMLFHGIAKLSNDQAMGFIKSSLSQIGLPEFIAYGVFIGEIVVPIMLIVGIASRLAGLILAGNMIFALVLAHRTTLFTLSQGGAWAIELDVFYLVLGICIAFLGSGKYSMKVCSDWN